MKNLPSWFTLSRIRRIGSFHVVVLQRTARKCIKISKARAEQLFCSLNLLFGDVLVAVAVVVCLSSLKTKKGDLGRFIEVDNKIQKHLRPKFEEMPPKSIDRDFHVVHFKALLNR